MKNAIRHKFFSGIFGHFFLRASIIQSLFAILFLLVVLPFFHFVADKMAAEQGRTFANSTLAASIDALYKNDYSSVVDYCMGVMKNTPNILFIVYSNIDGEELYITPNNWTFGHKSLPYYKMRFEKPGQTESIAQSHSIRDTASFFNPSGAVEYSRPIVIEGNDWGVLTVGFSKETYYTHVEAFTLTVIAFTLLASLLSFYMFYASSRRIRSQISLFGDIAQKLSEGHLSVRAPEAAIGEIGVLGSAINRMSSALEEKSERLLQLVRMVEQTEDGFILFNGSRHIIFANEALLELTGYPDSCFIGMSVTEFVRLLNLSLTELDWKSAVKTGARELLLTKKDQSEINIELRFESISSGKKEVQYLLAVFSDISERKRLEEKLQLAANVFSHAREGIMVTTENGIIIDVNSTFSIITGYSRDEVLGRKPSILSSGRQSKEFYVNMWSELLDKGHWHGEIWNRHKDGQVYPELLSISAVRDDQGKTLQYVSLSSDITEQKERESELVHFAHFDNLTDLPNRVLLSDRLNQAIALAIRDKGMLALMYLDLDKFKPVNDTFGHKIGDKLLRKVADRLKECVMRASDTVSRLGGDEFVILLSQIEAHQDTAIVAGKVINSLTLPFEIEQHTINISATIGIAIYPIHGANADTLMKNADDAMYQAKEAGRGCFRFTTDTQS